MMISSILGLNTVATKAFEVALVRAGNQLKVRFSLMVQIILTMMSIVGSFVVNLEMENVLIGEVKIR